MNPLILKVLFGTVAVGTAGTAASFTIYQTYAGSNTKGQEVLTDTTAQNPVVLVNSLTTLSTSPKLSVDGTDHEYKCKVSGATDETAICRLVKLDLSKSWIDVNGIKKATSSDTVQLTDLNSEDNHFKLEVNQAFYDKVNLSSPNHIEIISTTTANKTLAKLNISFKVSGSDIDYVSTKHLLGRLETAPASIDAATTHQCFLTTPTTDPVASKTCSIFAFGSQPTTFSGARYHKQTVSNLLATASTGDLTQHNSFVIEHTTPLNKRDIDAKKTLYLKKLTSNALSGDGKFENVVPVIMQGVTNKKAFILSETPSYSIIVKKSTALEANKTITHTNSTKNYQCKVSSVDFDCDLVHLDLSDSKTSLTTTAIKELDLTADFSLPHTDTKAKFFKLDVPLAQFKTIKTNLISASTPAAVDLVEITDGTAKIGTVTPLVAIDDDNVPYFQKSTFLVKNAVISGDDMSGNGAIDASKTHYCSFSTANSPAVNPQKCKLIDLGSSEISSSQEITDTEATSPITTEKNYLVNFIDDSGNPTTVVNTTKGENNLLFLEQEADAETKKLVAKFHNKDIQEALIVEGEASKKHLFILS